MGRALAPPPTGHLHRFAKATAGFVVGMSLGAAVVAVACAPKASARTSTPATSPAPPPSAPPAQPPPDPAEPVPTDPQIGGDIQALIRGDASIDHIGPEAYEAALARTHAHAPRYARAIHQRYCDFTSNIAMLLAVRVEHALARLYADAPGAVQMTARACESRLLQAKHNPEHDAATLKQIAARLPLMTTLAGGIDLPIDHDWPRVDVDEVCGAETPTGGGIRVLRRCTCGEKPICAVERADTQVSLTVRDNQAIGVCTDCYAEWSTCSLPPLAKNANVPVIVNGNRKGAIQTTATGYLTLEACVPKP